MTIRPYRPSDQTELLDVWFRAASIAHSFLPAEHFDQERITIASQYLPVAETWVYEHQEKVFGFISLLDQSVGGFFVDPAMQGQGLGRALMNHAVQMKSCLDVEVFEQNMIGRRFYKNYGFTETGHTYHLETGTKLVQMRFTFKSCERE
ncbi:MAG TPA: GNAT family N-acetyltransferase [Leptolyngbyaceae cyanobacterium]